MIIKDIIHPQSSPSDDLYPKTSVDQVDGLEAALDNVTARTKVYLHNLRFSLATVSFNFNIYSNNKSVPYTTLTQFIDEYLGNIINSSPSFISNTRIDSYYGVSNIVFSSYQISYLGVLGGSAGVRFFSGVFDRSNAPVIGFMDYVTEV